MWIRRFIYVIIDFLLSPFVFIGAKLFYLIREKGVENFKIVKRIFLKIGLFPIRDHYYEPMFNPRHLIRSLREDRILPGLDLNVKEQLAILEKFNYNDELLNIPLTRQKELNFYYNNINFASGDAEYYYNVIRFFKPSKIIEVGSGYSTLLAINAINKNKIEYQNYSCELICFEPFERKWLEKTQAKVIRKKIENIDLDFFKGLGENDIFFIDSSHILRPQGDVQFEFLEILPVLESHVLIHIHDIFTPKDYLNEWVIDKVWLYNEQYFLEAFLYNNSCYKVIGALNFLKHHYFEQLASKCPILKKQIHREPGSFWIAKK